MNMYVEHIGFAVEKPLETACWYVENLGFRLLKKVHNGPGADNAFIIDAAGGTAFELIGQPGFAPTFGLVPTLSQLHLAFYADDPHAEAERLVAAGAKFEGETPAAPGDTLLYLRDPYGGVIQLVKRKEPFIKK